LREPARLTPPARESVSLLDPLGPYEPQSIVVRATPGSLGGVAQAERRRAGRRRRRRRGGRRASRTATLTLLIACLCVTIAVGALLDSARQVPGGRETPPSALTPTVRPIPSALFVGDSYTAGTGAADPQQGYACLTATAMGWQCNVDGEGGTGFLGDGHFNSAAFSPLPDRLQRDATKFLADVIIVDAGRNDGRFPVHDVLTAANNYLQRLRRVWPKAPIVVIVPGYLWSTPEDDPFSVQLVRGLRSLLPEVGGYLIDPVGGRWIRPEQVSTLTWTDGIHPNASGHRYLAQRLTDALRADGLASLTLTDARRPAQPSAGPTTIPAGSRN
jgi:lysophospholipase L1-like esterase